MKNEDAKRILAASVVKAREIGKNVSLCVVDAAGTMIAFERMDGAMAFTSSLAEGKACTAAYTARETGTLAGMAENRPTLAAPIAMRLGERWVPVQGGVPIKDAEGIVIGAVGISGATSEEDEEIAKAGIAAL